MSFRFQKVQFYFINQQFGSKFDVSYRGVIRIVLTAISNFFIHIAHFDSLPEIFEFHNLRISCDIVYRNLFEISMIFFVLNDFHANVFSISSVNWNIDFSWMSIHYFIHPSKRECEKDTNGHLFVGLPERTGKLLAYPLLLQINLILKEKQLISWNSIEKCFGLCLFQE